MRAADPRVLEDGGVHEAGDDRADPDSEGSELETQGVAGRLHAELGRRIGDGERSRHRAGERPDVDDPPLPLAPHQGDGLGHELQAREEVHLEDVADLGARHLLDGGAGTEAGVVDEQIEPSAETPDGLVEDPLRIPLVGEVGSQWMSAAAFDLDLLGEALQSIRAPGDERDLEARRGQRARARLADARRGAGHESGSSVRGCRSRFHRAEDRRSVANCNAPPRRSPDPGSRSVRSASRRFARRFPSSIPLADSMARFADPVRVPRRSTTFGTEGSRRRDRTRRVTDRDRLRAPGAGLGRAEAWGLDRTRYSDPLTRGIPMRAPIASASIARLLLGMAVSVALGGCAALEGVDLERLLMGGPPLDERTVTQGLEQALRIGAERTTSTLSAPGGFSENPRLRLRLPGELGRVAEALRAVGLGGRVDALEASMNDAAERAAGAALPVFAS